MRGRDEIGRAWWEAKKAKIVRIAQAEPDMPLCLLSERFGETPKAILAILQDAGVRRERDGFWRGGRRRSA